MSIETEITVSPQAFGAAVAWAAKWVPGKPNVPVWGGLSLAVADNTLTIGAYDESASVRASIECAPYSDEPGSAVVSGRLLAALAATLTTRAPVTLVSLDEGRVVRMKQGAWVTTLPAMTGDSHPALPGALPAIGSVSGALLAQAVDRIAMATPDDGAKIENVFRTMRIEFGPKLIEIMSSDKRRVGRVAISWAGSNRAVVTPHGVTMIGAAAAFDGPDDVAIGTDGRSLSLTSPTRSLTMTTLDTEGKWPAEFLRNAGNEERPLAAVIEPAALITPLKRAGIVRGKEGPVAIRFSEGALALLASAEAEGLKRTSDDEIEIEYSGPETVVGFNPDYFADALASAPGAKVKLLFGIDRKHVILTSDDDPDWRHVLMPVVLPR